MTGQIARRVIEVFRKPPLKGVEQAQLTARENEILQYLSTGLSNKESASQINATIFTVREHIEHIYEKLHVHCRTEAAAKYLGSGSGAPIREPGLNPGAEPPRLSVKQ